MKKLTKKSGKVRNTNPRTRINVADTQDKHSLRQQSRALSRDTMELVLSGKAEINDTLKERMLDLLDLVVRTPLTPDSVGKDYYDLWDLKGKIEEDVWDEILGAVLGLNPGEPTDLALSYEDRYVSKGNQVGPDAAPSQTEEAEIAGDSSVPTSEGSASHEGAPSEEAQGATRAQHDDNLRSEAEEGCTSENATPTDEVATLEIVHPGRNEKKLKSIRMAGSAALVARGTQEKLSPKERTQLKNCQEVIFNGLDTFVQVGRAIATIIEGRLYRETHRKFEHYAEEVLGMTPRRAYQLKDASEVIENLKEVNNRSHAGNADCSMPMPVNENQMRALKNFAPDVQREIWREAVEAAAEAGAKQVTGKLLKEIIRVREKNDDAEESDQAQSEGTEHGAEFDENKQVEKVIESLNRFLHEWPELKRQVLYTGVQKWLNSCLEGQPTSEHRK